MTGELYTYIHARTHTSRMAAEGCIMIHAEEKEEEKNMKISSTIRRESNVNLREMLDF